MERQDPAANHCLKIYVSHASNFDYSNKLYKPIRESELNDTHEFILPHENSAEPFNAKLCIKTCDIIIAEVSFPSTGQGIELGWAETFEKPIICLYKQGSKVSSSLKYVADKAMVYNNQSELVGIIRQAIVRPDSLYNIRVS